MAWHSARAKTLFPLVIYRHFVAVHPHEEVHDVSRVLCLEGVLWVEGDVVGEPTLDGAFISVKPRAGDKAVADDEAVSRDLHRRKS